MLSSVQGELGWGIDLGGRLFLEKASVKMLSQQYLSNWGMCGDRLSINPPGLSYHNIIIDLEMCYT